MELAWSYLKGRVTPPQCLNPCIYVIL